MLKFKNTLNRLWEAYMIILAIFIMIKSNVMADWWFECNINKWDKNNNLMTRTFRIALINLKYKHQSVKDLIIDIKDLNLSIINLPTRNPSLFTIQSSPSTIKHTISLTYVITISFSSLTTCKYFSYLWDWYDKK